MFFALMNRMRHIRRWGLMRNIQNEDVLQHSAQCAMLAHALAVLGNRRLGRSYNPEQIALLALYHEAPEVLTGDLATPIKYFDPNIKNAYKHIEDLASQRLLNALPKDLRPDYAPLLSPAPQEVALLIKAADRLCAYIKCLEEKSSGNRDFKRASEATLRLLEEMNCPEVTIFMEDFLDAFTLTVDDLTGR